MPESERAVLNLTVPSWAHLVIVDGLLYVREQDAIHVYDVRAD